MSTPTYSDKDIKRILRNNGFVLQRQSGSHMIYVNGDGRHMAVRCSKCNKMVWQRLIKEYGLIV